MSQNQHPNANPTANPTVTRILQINASIQLDASQSTRLADAIVARLQQAHPQAVVQRRDLGRAPVPALDAAALAALFTPEEARTPDQAARVAADDALIAELQAADVIVLGVPMYNFGMPAQLKAWLDAVTRARVTFRYTEQGPVGLLTGKRVYVAHARGGRYRGTALDHVTPQLDTHLGFIGLGDVRHVYAEGFAMGDEARAAGLADAARQLAALFDEAADAVAA